MKEKFDKKLDKKIESALLKKALGFVQEEVVEEFVNSDNDIVLNKKKITKKNVPPDITAIKVLMGYIQEEEKDIKQMSNEELWKEKEKLKKILESFDDEDKDNGSN